MTALSKKELRFYEKAAVEAALAAGKIHTKYFNAPLNVQSKSDNQGLVTQADLQSEKKILSILRKATPKFDVMSEEFHSKVDRQTQKEGRWIIDPLDGTTNFVHRFPMFCVSIGLEVAGEIVVGVVYHPILKDLYVATKGGGAKLNGKKIQVSKTARISDALLTTGFAYGKDREKLLTEVEVFGRLSSMARATRRPGSAALDLAYVARGVFDGFWERGLSAWDVAAGSLLITEAGGTVSTYDGKNFSVYDREIIASNSVLHRPLSQTVSPEYCLL
jgi:myo-inositol-1(or 4)-monophosphatase